MASTPSLDHLTDPYSVNILYGMTAVSQQRFILGKPDSDKRQQGIRFELSYPDTAGKPAKPFMDFQSYNDQGRGDNCVFALVDACDDENAYIIRKYFEHGWYRYTATSIDGLTVLWKMRISFPLGKETISGSPQLLALPPCSTPQFIS